MDYVTLQELIGKNVHQPSRSATWHQAHVTHMELLEMLETPLSDDSPLFLNPLPGDIFDRMPLMRQIHDAAAFMVRYGPVKLTDAGRFPRKLVMHLLERGHFVSQYNRMRHWKSTFSEYDFWPMPLIREIMQLAGMTRKKSGKVHLTRKSDKLLEDHDLLVRETIYRFYSILDWTLFDRYPRCMAGIGVHMFGLNLLLLDRYGDEPRPAQFYADRYFGMFPFLVHLAPPTAHLTPLRYASR